VTDTNNHKDEEKLIPEVNLSADDQIIWIGLAVAALLFLGLGWTLFSDDDTENIQTVDTEFIAETEEELEPGSATAVVDSDTSENSNTTIKTEVDPLAVQPVADRFPGDITATRSGKDVTLTGYVATELEKTQAGTAIQKVKDVTTVNNQLVVLEPLAQEVLTNQEVAKPQASGIGTDITLTGSVANQTEKDAAATEVKKIEGIGTVTNNIQINAVDVINSLPQVEFAIESSRILDASFEDLYKAAEILKDVEDKTLEVQGYTDISGDEAANLALSQNRAEAIRNYLIGEGVDGDILVAKGYGETTKFAAGDTPEDYKENRKVLFEEQ